MSRVLIEMMTAFILVFYMYQPVMEDIYQTKAHAVEMVLENATQKASSAENGYFTPEIIKEIKDKLEKNFLIDPSTVVFTGTTTLTPRGEYIEGRLVVKSPQRWLFGSLLGEKDPKPIIRYSRQMSEYLIRD